MAAQLDKILQTEQAGRVTVQVVPFDIGAHAAQDSNVILFEFGAGPIWCRSSSWKA
jgi:hypothetical protein